MNSIFNQLTKKDSTYNINSPRNKAKTPYNSPRDDTPRYNDDTHKILKDNINKFTNDLLNIKDKKEKLKEVRFNKHLNEPIVHLIDDIQPIPKPNTLGDSKLFEETEKWVESIILDSIEEEKEIDLLSNDICENLNIEEKKDNKGYNLDLYKFMREKEIELEKPIIPKINIGKKLSPRIVTRPVNKPVNKPVKKTTVKKPVLVRSNSFMSPTLSSKKVAKK